MVTRQLSSVNWRAALALSDAIYTFGSLPISRYDQIVRLVGGGGSVAPVPPRTTPAVEYADDYSLAALVYRCSPVVRLDPGLWCSQDRRLAVKSSALSLVSATFLDFVTLIQPDSIVNLGAIWVIGSLGSCVTVPSLWLDHL